MLPEAIQPLRPTEALLQRFARLAQEASRDSLLGELIEAAAQLSQADLCQLYLLDATHTSLNLSAAWLDEQRQSCHDDSLPADYDGQLLQYCLFQNRPLALTELHPSLHAVDFLPAGYTWKSLLCLPLADAQGSVQGVMVCATHRTRDLETLSSLLSPLGTFAIAQLNLLQRLQTSEPETAPVVESVKPCASGYGMIGDSVAMRGVYQLIGKVLHNPVTVLLTGETGTGKELVARAIHDCGARRTQAFVVQNCAALPENLLESELFGYRKGAFTGADRDRQGLFDAANGGTLFLDEIGDMPLTLQAKLLRVLQEGEVRPLGSTETHKVDVRIIAATHRDLYNQVLQGNFREDLYYRLTHFPIELPALRERGDDIPRLARHFAENACSFLQREPCRWTEAALDRLAGYAFPGNVRELKGLVERAVLLCDGNELRPEHFPLRQETMPEVGLTLRERMDQLERGLVIDCLRKNNGNQTHAARELGLPRRTLLYRMERLNISPTDL